MPNRDHCCVPKCHNNRAKKIKNLTFYQFPKDKALRKMWICKIRRDVGKYFKVSDLNYSFRSGATCNVYIFFLQFLQITDSTRVCSHHFKNSEIMTTRTGKRILVRNAVPSVFKWSKWTTSRKRKSSKKRQFTHAERFDKSVPTATVTGKSLAILAPLILNIVFLLIREIYLKASVQVFNCLNICLIFFFPASSRNTRENTVNVWTIKTRLGAF